MAMPGLTAEASLYRTTGRYYTTWSGSAPAGVVPQQFGDDVIPPIGRGFPCSICNSVCQECLRRPLGDACRACAYCCRRCDERCGAPNAVDVLEAVVSAA